MGKFRPDPKPPKKEKKKYFLKRTPIKKKPRKVTGELLVFKMIFSEREHVSEVSGIKIEAFDVRIFSHILPKSTYPKYRLLKENIIIITPEEHQEWEFGSRTDSKWDHVKEKAEELRQRYNSSKTYNRF